MRTRANRGRRGASLRSAWARRAGALGLVVLGFGLWAPGGAWAGVSQYDLSTGGALTSKAVPIVNSDTNGAPYGVAVSPDGKSVYVTNQDGISTPGTVSQYDVGPGGGLSPKAPATVATGASPFGIALSPDGKSVYVTSYETDTVSQYDVGAGGVLSPKTPATVSTDANPYGVAVSPDGKSVYVADYGSQDVSQYDVGAGGVLSPKTPATVASGLSPDDVTVSPDGKSAYVTNQSDGTVSQYDIGAGGLLKAKTPATVTTSGFADGVAVSPDGKSVYVADADKTSPNTAAGVVSQFDVGPGGVLSPKTPATAPTGIFPERVAVSPDGKSAYLTNATDGTVSQYDIGAGGKLSAKTPATVSAGGPLPFGVAISPDGKSAYVAERAVVTARTHTLTVAKAGSGSGTVTSSPAGIDCGATCSDAFTDGTMVTLTATAAAGSTFAGWSGGGCSGTGACTVTISANTTVTATFTASPGTHTLTVAKAGSGSGTVTSSPAGIDCGATCSDAFTDGTMVTLTATAAAGSTFAGWSGGGCSGTGACTVTISANTTVTATFTASPGTHTLTVAKAGSGSGTVTSSPAGIDCGATCSDAFTDGTMVTLTATAAAGSTFAGWSGGGCSGTGACTVTISANTTVTATFTASGGGGGGGAGGGGGFVLAPTVQSSCSASAISQSGATLSATVDPNGLASTYHFDYGTTTGYGSSTSEQPVGSDSQDDQVSATVSGLGAGTTYHCRAVATSAAGVTYGADQTFTTGHVARRAPARLHLRSIRLTPARQGCQVESKRSARASSLSDSDCTVALLTLAGTIDNRADGQKLTIALRGELGRRGVLIVTRTGIRNGHWRLRARLPGRDLEPGDRWRIAVAYSGNAQLLSATVTGGFMLEIEITNASPS